MGEDGELQWARRCLDAIHKIRQQKQRPSLERIVHAVRQQHSSPESVVAAHLEKLVSHGLILKVFNKGLSTYKDPGCGGRQVVAGRDADLTKIVVKGVRELAEKTPDGCTQKALEAYLQTSLVLSLEKGADFGALVRNGLKRAVARGAIQVSKNLYRPAPGSSDGTPGRKPKVPRTSKGDVSLSPKKEGLPICLECLGTSQNNKAGVEEELKFCASCGSGIHPSCLPGNHGEIFKLLLSRGNLWRCEECYQCPNCSTSELVAGIVCMGCDRGFHIGCLEPVVDKKGHGKWSCQSCTDGKPPPSTPTSGSPMQRKQHSSLRVAHLKSLRKAARANLVRRRGKVKEGNESSSEDVTSIASLMNSELPPGVTEKDVETFKMAREKASEMTKEQQTLPEGMASPKDKGLPPRCPAAIEFGNFLIKTWYSSPFPQEYARLGKLFLCEFCLKYAKSKVVLNRHLEKCSWRHPPGTEIYRHKDISVFEVDGNVAKFYCQNLCLLAKLFLDHKTLYYDVEPFLFYILTISDDIGFHVVGYFSKEKHCVQKYNVSCIMTLPQYQRKGYGRFLIDFSYLLSKAEGMAGTPEKPLSDLGRVSYHAYWRSVILEYLDTHRNADITLEQISKDTGLHVEDIGTSIEEMKLVRDVGGNAALVVDWAAVDSHAARVKASSTRIPLVPEALRWTPLVPQIVNPFQPPEEEGEDEFEEEESEPPKEKVEVKEEEVEEEKEVIEETPKGRGRHVKTESVRKSSPSPSSRGAKKLKSKETPPQKATRTPSESTRGNKAAAKAKLEKQVETPVALRKRKRASAPEAPTKRSPSPEPEPLPPKRRCTEIIRPRRSAASVTNKQDEDESEEEDESSPPPLITRTGRVSSLKLKGMIDKKTPKKSAGKVVGVNKMSIAAKLRWMERKKKELLSQASGEVAEKETPKAVEKRKPGRPAKLKTAGDQPSPKLKLPAKSPEPVVKSEPVVKTEPRSKSNAAESTPKSSKTEVKAEVSKKEEDDEVEEEPEEKVVKPVKKKVEVRKKPKRPGMDLKRFGQKKRRGWIKGKLRGKKSVVAENSTPADAETAASTHKASTSPVIASPTKSAQAQPIEEDTTEKMDIGADESEVNDEADSLKNEKPEDESVLEKDVDDSKFDEDEAKPESKVVIKEPELVDIAACDDDDDEIKEEVEDVKKQEEIKADENNDEDAQKKSDEKDDEVREISDCEDEKEEEGEKREVIKVERRVLSDDSDDSRPPRSDHSRSPSPRHSSDDDLDMDKKSSPLSAPVDSVEPRISPPKELTPKLDIEPLQAEPAPTKSFEPIVQELLKPDIPPNLSLETDDTNKVKIEEKKFKEEKRDDKPIEKREVRLGNSSELRATVDLTQDDDSPPEPLSQQHDSRERNLVEPPRKMELPKALIEEKPREEIPQPAHCSVSSSERLVGPFVPVADSLAAQQKKATVSALERAVSDRAANERAASERAAIQAAAERAMAASVQIFKAQERAPQVSCYTDCAQQAAAAAHHQHHMASQHMVHYHQQQAAMAMQQAQAAVTSKSSSSSSSRSKSSSSNSQRHQVGSPQPNYQAQAQSVAAAAAASYSAYMIHRSSASPASQPPPRPVPCSNFYLQQSGQQPGSLAKLQQMTNGLDTLSPQLAGTTPPPQATHGTPPPTGSYPKFYQGPTPTASATASSAAGRHAQQLLPQYGPAAFNGYRPPQQPTSTPPYLATANSNFINAQQMQMMNVQPQYTQDQGSAAAANPMYTYGYLNGTLMQPLNSTMRR